MKSVISHHRLISYFVLAYLISWAMIALIPISFLFALGSLFGPAIAAMIVTSANEGRRGLKTLFDKLILWRVNAIWYLAAVGLPLLLCLAVLVINGLLSGKPVAFNPGGDQVLTSILALLVVGEELGWRGYALPHLQDRYNGLVSSLILGGLWAAWHLANISIPGLQYYGYAFPAFLLYVLSMTILLTWLVNNARGSVLIAWIFHASINVSGSLFFIGDQPRQWLISGTVFGIFAVIVVIFSQQDFFTRPIQKGDNDAAGIDDKNDARAK